MTTIFFRKNLAYDPTLNGVFNRYEGYVRIVRGIEDPGIIPNQQWILPTVEGVYCSSTRRARETAGGGAIVLSSLQEVRFNLEDLATSEEFNREGSNLIRRRFVEAFIEDNLEEKRWMIRQRVEQILTLGASLKKGNYLMVSHSFLMKIIEVYFSEPQLFEQPKILADHLMPEKKTYSFGEGFEIQL